MRENDFIFRHIRAVVVHAYREAVRRREEATVGEARKREGLLEQVVLRGGDGQIAQSRHANEEVAVEIITKPLPESASLLTVTFVDRAGQALLHSRLALPKPTATGPSHHVCRFDRVPLSCVDVRLAVTIVDAEGAVLDANSDAARLTFVGDSTKTGMVTVEGAWS